MVIIMGIMAFEVKRTQWATDNTWLGNPPDEGGDPRYQAPGESAGRPSRPACLSRITAPRARLCWRSRREHPTVRLQART